MKTAEFQVWKKRLIEVVRTYKYVILVLAAGLVLLLLPPIWGAEDGADETEETQTQLKQDPDFSTTELETRLEEALAQIQGVGEVEVVLTLKSGPQDILAQDSDTSVDEQGTQSTLSNLTLSQGSGREEAVVIQQLSPQYQGALVVCSGGDEPEVRLRLVEAVSALTGLGADKISVCKGK